MWAGHFAATIGLGPIEKDLEGGGPAFLDRLRERLVKILTNGLLPALERAEAGFALGRLGDPRPGVCNFDPAMWAPLPGGRFTMGDKKDGPPHVVELSPFKISKYPITNSQFEEFMKAGGYGEKSGKQWWSKEGWKYRQEQNWEKPRYWDNDDYNLLNQPVVGVSWFEAEAFCNWLTTRLRAEKQIDKNEIVRLPTEAEWEFAARGKAGRVYPWDKDDPTPEHANYDDSKINRTTAVGCYSKGVTTEGVFDLAGNVWEWCRDWYFDNYYVDCKKLGVVKNPPGPKTGPGRAVRGGSWFVSEVFLRAALRYWNYPVFRSIYGDFRVVVAAES